MWKAKNRLRAVAFRPHAVTAAAYAGVESGRGRRPRPRWPNGSISSLWNEQEGTGGRHQLVA